MHKYRQLHLKILDSDDFNDMPDEFTRLVWVLLPLILDSEGRGIADATWIRSRVFPRRKDVTDQQVRSAFVWFLENGMVIEYQVDGRNYFYVPNFKKYQKGTQYEAASLLPDPLEGNLQVTSKLPQGLIKPTLIKPPPDVIESVYESESLSTSLNEKKIFSIRDAEKAICQVTGWIVVPSGWTEHTDNVLTMLQHFGWDETIDKLSVSKNDWVTQHRKDNGKKYSLLNPTWINNAITGETVGAPKALSREERDQKELERLIAEANK